MVKKSIYVRVYELACEGVPAKKICIYVQRDKARISRILKALVDAGFLTCANPGDRIRFYAPTKKKFSPDDSVILSTILREKIKKNDYGGYYSRCHGVSFKAEILSFKKEVKWDKSWLTRGCQHFVYRYPFKRLGDVCFTRIVGKTCDTLRVDIPPVRWNVVRGDPEQFLLNMARKLMGWFCDAFEVSVSGLVKCDGEKHGLVVRQHDLVRVAQEKTIKWSNGVELDASHGVPEFEGPWDVMSELLRLPKRVESLECRVRHLEVVLERVIVSMERVEKNIVRVEQSINQMVDGLNVPGKKDTFNDVT